MDRTLIEFDAVENAGNQADNQQVRELDDLQLAMVGGGAGDTIMH